MKKNLEKILNKMSDNYIKNKKLVIDKISTFDINDAIEIGQSEINCINKLRFLNTLVLLERNNKKLFNKQIIIKLLESILVDYLSKDMQKELNHELIAEHIKLILQNIADYDLFEQTNIKLIIENRNTITTYAFKKTIQLIEYYINNRFEEVGFTNGKTILRNEFKQLIKTRYLRDKNELCYRIISLSNEEAKDFINYYFEWGIQYINQDGTLLHICLKDEKKNLNDIELIIDKLLELGIDPNIYDKINNPYLYYEIKYKYGLDSEKYLLDDNGFKKSLERAIKYGYDVNKNDYLFRYLYDNGMMNDKVFEILYDNGVWFGYNHVISTFITHDQAFSKQNFTKLKFLTSYNLETIELVKKLEKNKEGLELEINFFKHILEVSDTIENLLCEFGVYFEKEFDTIPDLSEEASDIIEYIYNLLIEDKKNSINTNNKITVSDILKILSKINNTIYNSVDRAIEENNQKILTLPNK